MKCNNCNKEIAESAKFCSDCGSTIPKIEVHQENSTKVSLEKPIKENKQNEVVPEPVQQSEVVPEATNANNEQNDSVIIAKEKINKTYDKKHSKNILIFCAISLFLFIFMFLNAAMKFKVYNLLFESDIVLHAIVGMFLFYGIAFLVGVVVRIVRFKKMDRVDIVLNYDVDKNKLLDDIYQINNFSRLKSKYRFRNNDGVEGIGFHCKYGIYIIFVNDVEKTVSIFNKTEISKGGKFADVINDVKKVKSYLELASVENHVRLLIDPETDLTAIKNSEKDKLYGMIATFITSGRFGGIFIICIMLATMGGLIFLDSEVSSIHTTKNYEFIDFESKLSISRVFGDALEDRYWTADNNYVYVEGKLLSNDRKFVDCKVAFYTKGDEGNIEYITINGTKLDSNNRYLGHAIEYIYFVSENRVFELGYDILDLIN